MSNTYVLVDQPYPQVTRLTLNRADKHNAFNPEMIAELTQQLIQCQTDANTRIVLLAAKGKNFSAGADIQWMQQMVQASQQDNIDDALQLAHLMQTLYQLSKPTIALVQGAVMGGGIGLVACCDIAIATAETFFCFSEVKIGLIPAVISPYIIQAIGERATRRYFLTAEKISADKAFNLGLIHECLEKQDLETTVASLIKKLSANSPEAMTASKALISHINKAPIDDDIRQYTANEIAKIRVSPSGQEGLRAFLEKRAAKW